jgi:hypothetical protein
MEKKKSSINSMITYLNSLRYLSKNEIVMIKHSINKGYITSIEELKAYVYLEKNPEYLNI